MRAVIFSYFGTPTDPGAEVYRERTIGVHGGTESTLREDSP
ncbi:hypothetical protein [Actinoplanes palleronii]|nr:hypothetical protein [Actinoplanes palleronii]